MDDDPFFLWSEVYSFLTVIFIPSFKSRIQNPLQLMQVFPSIFTRLWSSPRCQWTSRNSLNLLVYRSDEAGQNPHSTSLWGIGHWWKSTLVKSEILRRQTWNNLLCKCNLITFILWSSFLLIQPATNWTFQNKHKAISVPCLCFQLPLMLA